jgi:DNA polymerase-3 subunit epsilon
MVATLPRQRSFDDLGTPLVETTFCVLDLETTGGSANGGDAITEVGAVKVRGGEVLGTFQTLVNPGTAIPPAITYLTGITQAMVVPAPRIDSVLPSLIEFVGNDAVIVGHNVRFDMSFLQAAARQLGYARWGNRVVDTCALARRLVREEVPNLKLGTLAERFRLTHRPSHRALDDALATVDLLHLLLERAGTLGVLGRGGGDDGTEVVVGVEHPADRGQCRRAGQPLHPEIPPQRRRYVARLHRLRDGDGELTRVAHEPVGERDRQADASDSTSTALPDAHHRHDTSSTTSESTRSSSTESSPPTV